jgi:hypothetical protein
MDRRLVQLLVVVAALGPLAAVASAAPTGRPVTVVEPDSITVDPSSAKPTTLTISNSSERALTVRFSAVLDDGTATVRPRRSTIRPYGTERVGLTVSPADKSASTEGDLVVTPIARGSLRRAIGPSTSVPIAVDAPTDDSRAEWLLLGLSFLVAAWIVFVHCWLRMPHRFKVVRRTMGPVGWDFSQSWGSNLTAVGAVIATVLAANVLPNDTAYISSDGYTILSLSFGIMVVVAPFLYVATQRATPVAGAAGPKLRGRVWAFLIACVVTLWGVLGELATSGMIFAEIEKAGSLPSHVAAFAIVLLAVTVGLVYLYATTTIGAIVESQGYLKHRGRANRRQAEASVPATTLGPPATAPAGNGVRQPSWQLL